MLAATKDTGAKKEEVESVAGTASGPIVEEPPAHVTKALKCLAELEERDPKTVHEAKRFFLK
jgi:hypothetical protein